MTPDDARTRRQFARGVALVGATGLLSAGSMTYGSRPSLALDALEWTVTGAEIASDDGSVSAVTFGETDPDADAIQVHYEGVNTPPTDLEFEIRLKGTDQGDGGWAGGSDETDWASLADGRVEIDRTSAEETYSWTEIFDDPTPVDVAAHSEIELEDFEAPAGSTITQQVLAVEVKAVIPDMNDLSATATATATVSVMNPTSTVRVGFVTGQFGTGDEADETLFMTDGQSAPTPADIDVTAFDSAVVTINGAGGASGDRAGGRGGRIVAEADLSGTDTLRAWVGQRPSGRTGGWGGHNGGAGGQRNAGGGGGSSHLAVGTTTGNSVLIADGGGGGGDGGGLLTPGHGGGGGARGGNGGSGSLAGNNGQRGGGTGSGGAGGTGPSIGTGGTGGHGGQQANTGAIDLSVISSQTGGGNAGHADITLELRTDEWASVTQD